MVPSDAVIIEPLNLFTFVNFGTVGDMSEKLVISCRVLADLVQCDDRVVSSKKLL